MKKWEDAKLITQRYRKYREHARYQQNIILSGDFIDGLVQELARLQFSIEEIMPATASLALTLRLLKDDEMFPKYRVEKSRYYNTKCHSQRCHRTPQLVPIPDAGSQKSRARRNRAPGRYLGSCRRVSQTISASVHLRHLISHSPALPR